MSSTNNAERIRQKWSAGELCIGTQVGLIDAAVSELFGEAGYDFLWIDMEHSPVTLADAAGHVRAARASGTAPWIRVPSKDPVVMKPILDLHPAGVIIPRIASLADAETGVASCKYPPRGVRGYGPSRGIGYGRRSIAEYLDNVDAELAVILQIEHINAVRDIDSILGVPGVDSVVTGPSDLAASMGLTGQPAHPDVLAAIEEVFRAARQRNVPAGHGISYDPAAVRYWFRLGLAWLCFDADFITLFRQSRLVIEGVRGICSGGRR
jgi:2-dehydro-3-deoxyglucarate aldolase/4-hydroxy-2-oxoheptanedioate aldolase